MVDGELRQGMTGDFRATVMNKLMGIQTARGTARQRAVQHVAAQYTAYANEMLIFKSV